jgi:3',5'-cyclic AMP phosphodiesterase CpdA
MFTLAHLSDIHLSPMPKLKKRELLGRRMLGFINWQRRKQFHQRAVLDLLTADLRAQSPDHIAVTGDLINIGAAEEYVQALAWLESLGPPDRVTVAPGNHDAYVHSWWENGMDSWACYMDSNAAGQRFNGRLRPEPLDSIRGAPHWPSVGGVLLRAARVMRSGRLKGSRHAEARFPFVRVVADGVALIGLSSALPTLPTLASGRVGWPQLERLAASLSALGREGMCRVVLIHHPPLPGMTDWSRALHDADDLTAVLRRFGAELVLHGHHHRHTVNWLETSSGVIPIVGAPSASAAHRVGRKPAARFNMYRIERAGERWRVALTGRALRAENFAAGAARGLPLFEEVEQAILSGETTPLAAGVTSATP